MTKVMDAINATLGDPSFITGSDVSADALKATQTLKNWCEGETNRHFLAAFSEGLVKDLEGAVGTTSTLNCLNREKVWRDRSFFVARQILFLGGSPFCNKEELLLH